LSATNRGAERAEEENYPTPAWCVHRLFDGLGELGVELPRGHWHEIMAGDGAIIRAVEKLGVGPKSWCATDIRDGVALAATLTEMNRGVHALRPETDYLTAQAVECDVILTNPAFSLAQDTITKALNEAPWVVMLLRLNFKGSDERNAWLRGNMPDELTLPNRPQFVASYSCEPRDKHDRGCGWKQKTPIDAPKIKLCPVCGRKTSRVSSDSAEYGWFVWGPERGRRIGRSLVLPTSSPEERGVKVRKSSKALCAPTVGEAAPEVQEATP
jgi:hypothetical protein